MAQLYIGTSGWSYAHWRNNFYAGIPRKDWLQHYSRQFKALEINASFYRLQQPSTYRAWYESTPADFCFTLKANRYLTHSKKLNDPAPAITIEKQHAQVLADKLRVVLWQLPGNFHCHEQRLESFVQALSLWGQVRHCIEFRHPSWFNNTVADLLAENQVTICQSHARDWPLWEQVKADLVYLRLHGYPQTYRSSYGEAEIDHWAGKVGNWLAEKQEVHVYFDNDAEAAAPRNALSLCQKTEGQAITHNRLV